MTYHSIAVKDADSYDRQRHLPPLLALWPHELKNTPLIIAKLEAALAIEQRRGKSSHWAYDINRHMALISALTAERKKL